MNQHRGTAEPESVGRVRTSNHRSTMSPTGPETDRGRSTSTPPTLRVAVTGVGGGTGQSIVRALQDDPRVAAVMGLDMNPYSAGFAWCDASHVVPVATSDEYVEKVATICARESVDVLIPGSDPELRPLSMARERLLDSGTDTIVSSPQVITICYDKLEMARFLASVGLPLARTEPVTEARRLADEVGYPLVIKPMCGSASRDVHIVFSEDELAPYE